MCKYLFLKGLFTLKLPHSIKNLQGSFCRWNVLQHILLLRIHRWSNSPFPDQGNLVWDVILLMCTVMSTQVLIETAFRSKVPPSQLFWNHGQTRSKFSTAPAYLWACLQLGVVSETQEGQDEISRRLNDANGPLPVLQLPAAVTVVLIFSLQSLGTQVVAQQLIQVHRFVWFVGRCFQWGVFWGLLQNSRRRRLKKVSWFLF